MKGEQFPIHLLQLLPREPPIQDVNENRETVYLKDNPRIKFYNYKEHPFAPAGAVHFGGGKHVGDTVVRQLTPIG